MSYTTEETLEKVLSKERIDLEEGVELLHSSDLTRLGMAADSRTAILHPEPYRTYAIDRNVNYTNICVARCDFCAFSTDENGEDANVITEQELFEKIQETLEQGGTQILMQGGMHPRLRLNFYQDMLRSIKERFSSIHIHAFSPPEILHLSQLEKLPINTVISKLRSAGLDSIPGGGAEILVDRCRDEISPKKCTSDEWLTVMREAHKLGMKTTATMMFGHIETLEERIVHMDKIRRLQDETGGFTAFIPWTFQPRNTRLDHLSPVGAFEYLKTLAVSRLYLDNIPNVQASWVTQGPKIGQLALKFGANDMGSTMIEENVVRAAGVSFMMCGEEIERLIKDIGYQARQRDFYYRLVN
ncbi:MAG: dehypoxanthine futalosine cyclase [Candidatus Brocadiales bacterium]|nr:dehypoxanthine futalosine cyclase [Candidatus Bathyanammoxibius amoris]